MKIQAGKRYVRRDGKVTGIIEDSGDRFYDPASDMEYDENGFVELRSLHYPTGQDPWDLKSEIKSNDIENLIEGQDDIGMFRRRFKRLMWLIETKSTEVIKTEIGQLERDIMPALLHYKSLSMTKDALENPPDDERKL